MELSYLNTVLRVARSLWNFSFQVDPIRNAREAFKMLGVITTPRERARRPTEKELKTLGDYFNESFRYRLPMADIMDFAIATAMRAGEILSITWEDVDTKKKTVHRPHIPYKTATISSTFHRACAAKKIMDLRFHDLRHEGTGRLFEMR